MSDQPPRSDTPQEGVADPDRDTPSGMAPWQKVTAVLALAVLVFMVVLLAGGEHGPARHTPGRQTQQPVEDGSLHDTSRSDH